MRRALITAIVALVAFVVVALAFPAPIWLIDTYSSPASTDAAYQASIAAMHTHLVGSRPNWPLGIAAASLVVGIVLVWSAFRGGLVPDR